MIEAPRPDVMISALTEQGAQATLDAIGLGAMDFVAKPGGTVSREIDQMRPLIVQKVRAAAAARVSRTLHLRERIRHQLRGAGIVPAPARAQKKPPQRGGHESASDGLVLIGTSTGGPAALDIVLARLPASFPWPIMIAQHMPATFTGPFAKRLDRQCDLQVIEVNRPVPLQAGTAYIGRGDADLVVASRTTGLAAMPVPAGRDYPWHPSTERMVTTALDHYPPSQLIGVLMTGMGNDGVHAMTRLRNGGGRTIAEAESTAAVWGMPGELVKSGGAEFVRPVDEIADAILELVSAHASH
jgi:two-component system chemotaxis response regulator CheB